MRAIVVAVLALCALAWVLPASASSSQETLRRAALDHTDLGSDFILLQEGTVPEMEQLGVPSYMVSYVRLPSVVAPSFDIVVSLLADVSAAGDLDGEEFARGMEQALAGSEGLKSVPIDAPTIGDQSWRYKVSGDLSGQKVSGELVVWRHGSVIAAVFALGQKGADASGYATKQEAKLTVALGG
jgi:hypothetical protein